MSDNKKIIRNDIVLVAVILFMAVAVFLVFKSTMETGDFAVVSIDGVEEYRYSLSENTQVTIKTGENDEQTNVLVIKDGKAHVSSANCPDKICAEHRAISKTGETIVCLPHKVVVSIVSDNNGNSLPDAVI